MTKRISSLKSVYSIPFAIFDNPSLYIKMVREGIEGEMVRQAITYTGERDLFIRVLNTTSGNLNRYYQKKSLPRSESEQVLDTLKIYRYANKTLGSETLGSGLEL